MVLAVTALLAVLAGLVGLGAGFGVQRAARRYVPATTTDTPTTPAESGPSTVAIAPPAAVGVRVPAPVPAVVTAVLCGLAALRFGPTWQLPAFLVLAAAGVLLAVIDLEHLLLPNRIIGPTAAAAAALLAFAAVAGGDGHALLRAALGAAVLFVLYLVLALVAPSGLGMGDVKLAGVLGLYLGWLGWGSVLIGTFTGFLLGGLVGVALMAVRRAGRKSALAFGPFMLAGAFVAVFFANPLASWYLSLFTTVS
jgi:leader peptidase (prepilin peptidase)/N-methyltransferase